MNILETNFEGLFTIEPKILGDERGWFMRTFDEKIFYQSIPNFNSKWVQMNHSFNKEKNTWRGFHFQNSPFQETKLVRCISGAIIDYVVDLRQNSKSFLSVYQIKLSAENKKMLFIPKGFAHGFYTLENNTEILYLHDEFYNQEYESGIRYNDTLLNFNFSNKIKNISSRDESHPLLLKEFKGF